MNDKITFHFHKLSSKIWQVFIKEIDDGSTSEHIHTSLRKALTLMLYTLYRWKPGEKFSITVERNREDN